MRTEWIVVAVVAALALYAVIVFNRLIRQRNVVREGWSGIDVQLRRRTDLVPNLVQTVQAYAAHERGLFEEVTKRRAGEHRGERRRRTGGGGAGACGLARPPDGGGGSLSGAQGRQEFPRSAGRAFQDRGSDPDGAPLLQRRGAQPEYQHPIVPGRAAGAPSGVQGGAVLRARGPRARRRPRRSRFREASHDRDPPHCAGARRAAGGACARRRGRAHPALRQRRHGRAQRRPCGHRDDRRAGGRPGHPPRHSARFSDRLPAS